MIYGIRNSTCFLLFLSPDVTKSRFVLEELRTAIKYNRPLLVLYTESFDLAELANWPDIELPMHDAIPFHYRAGETNTTLDIIKRRLATITAGTFGDALAPLATSIVPPDNNV